MMGFSGWNSVNVKQWMGFSGWDLEHGWDSGLDSVNGIQWMGFRVQNAIQMMGFSRCDSVEGIQNGI